MNSMLVAGIFLLVVVAAAFMVLWIVDARRADRVATDPERVEETPRRRWWRPRPK
jgi:hypothetical protein